MYFSSLPKPKIENWQEGNESSRTIHEKNKNIKCQLDPTAILMLGKGVMKCMREFVCLLLQQIEGEVEGG